MQLNLNPISPYLSEVAEKELNNSSLSWYKEKVLRLSEEFNKRTFYLTFSSISRKIEDKTIHLSSESIDSNYSFSIQSDAKSVVRALLLNTLDNQSGDYTSIINELFETADLNEQISLCSLIQFLPFSHVLHFRATEALRTNAKSVFEAIAHHNLFPLKNFDDEIWNHMILKSLFLESPLNPVTGLLERRNQKLSSMCLDYFHERMAASRIVTPEIWIMMEPYIDDNYIDAIQYSLKSSPETEKRAVAIAFQMQDETWKLQHIELHKQTEAIVSEVNLDWATFQV